MARKQEVQTTLTEEPTESATEAAIWEAQGENGVESIDALRAALGREQYIGYLRGMVLMQTWAIGRSSNPQREAMDGMWFQSKLIDVLSEEA